MRGNATLLVQTQVYSKRSGVRSTAARRPRPRSRVPGCRTFPPARRLQERRPEHGYAHTVSSFAPGEAVEHDELRLTTTGARALCESVVASDARCNRRLFECCETKLESVFSRCQAFNSLDVVTLLLRRLSVVAGLISVFDKRP